MQNNERALLLLSSSDTSFESLLVAFSDPSICLGTLRLQLFVEREMERVRNEADEDMREITSEECDPPSRQDPHNIHQAVTHGRPSIGAAVLAWKARQKAGQERRYQSRGDAMRAEWRRLARDKRLETAVANGKQLRDYRHLHEMTDDQRRDHLKFQRCEKQRRYRAKLALDSPPHNR